MSQPLSKLPASVRAELPKPPRPARRPVDQAKPKPLTIDEKKLLPQYFSELFLGRKQYEWCFKALEALSLKGSRVALRAANGCIGAEQMIYDPVLGISRRVDEIHGQHHVYAWDEANKRVVVAEANAPFIKTERDRLYEVVLGNGQTIVVSPGHRFLTPYGWRRFGEMKDGDAIIAPEVPSGGCAGSITTVIKSRLLRTDDIWDFEVPGLHNYIAGGVVNHNSGKTSEVAVVAILWHMIRFPGSQTVVTAGVYRQIAEVLWPVIRARVNGMGPDIASLFEITENRIKYNSPSLPGEPPREPSLCNGFSADKPEAAEGWHGRGPSGNLLYVIDEAKAVPNGIFDAMERCQPTRLLVMSSPGGAAGAFYDIFRRGDDRYSMHRVTSYDCPHIEKKWIDEQIAAYGERSAVVQSMIYAEFCDEDGGSLVLPPGVLQRNLSSPPAKLGTHLRVGIDFAAGGDENVIQVVEGNLVRETIKWREKDTMAAVGRFITELKRLGVEPHNVWADGSGIGIPMCDALREAGWSVNRVNNGEAAFDSDKFANRGTEMWVQMARQVELGKIILPKDDDVLHRQLTTRRLEHNAKGKLIIEPKDKMKKRGLDSPDRADALVLALCGGGQSVEEFMRSSGKRVSFGDIEVDDLDAIPGAFAG